MNPRKRKVLQSALQLFTEKGFQHTSIQDIIQRAEISKGTFYNYFSSKNECFVAILETSRYEASLRRHELIDGQDKRDRHILAKQVAVLMEINEERNLVPLFEGVFQSSDAELKKYLTEHRLYEVEWLMTRLIDVYGEEVRPYSYEAATGFFGLMQHISITYRITYHTNIDPYTLAEGVLRHIDAMIRAMIAHEHILLPADSFFLRQTQLQGESITPASLIERLNGFIQQLQQPDFPEGVQFAQAMIEEIERPSLRFAILELLIKPFREAFHGTSHEVEAREVAHLFWTYITQLKKDASHT